MDSGGVEQRRLLMARGLPRDRFVHAVVTQEAHGVLPGALAAEGWPVHAIGPAPHILAPGWHARAVRHARRFRPDIVHGAVYEGVALAAAVAWAMPGVAMIAEETSDPVDRSPRGDLLMRALLLRARKVIGVSPAAVAYLRGRARQPDRKVVALDNAVPPHPTPPPDRLAALAAGLGLSPDDEVVGTVGRLVDSHKRVSDLLRALPALLAARPRARLLVVGDGPDRPALEALARALGVADRATFAGYRGDARDLYPLLRAFALASAHEAFGLVLVEAMHAGVPVVATAVGGIPHVLDGGRAGLLVPPGDPPALAAALARALADGPERAALVAAGHARAGAFAPGPYLDRLAALYEELAA